MYDEGTLVSQAAPGWIAVTARAMLATTDASASSVALPCKAVNSKLSGQEIAPKRIVTAEMASVVATPMTARA
jgi:hypothetical protein